MTYLNCDIFLSSQNCSLYSQLQLFTQVVTLYPKLADTIFLRTYTFCNLLIISNNVTLNSTFSHNWYFISRNCKFISHICDFICYVTLYLKILTSFLILNFLKIRLISFAVKVAPGIQEENEN